MSRLWVPPGVVDTGDRQLPEARDYRAPSGLLWRFMENDAAMPNAQARWWQTGHREGLRVCVSIDDTDKFGPLLHLSISHRSRYPIWDEIHEARDVFLPEFREFAMYLPPRGEYVNVHPNCFHLHEVTEACRW